MLTGFIVWIQRTVFFSTFTLILCTENFSYTEFDCCTILICHFPGVIYCNCFFVVGQRF